MSFTFSTPTEAGSTGSTPVRISAISSRRALNSFSLLISQRSGGDGGEGALATMFALDVLPVSACYAHQDGIPCTEENALGLPP